jgi:autotransporter-associated beta strand protein
MKNKSHILITSLTAVTFQFAHVANAQDLFLSLDDLSIYYDFEQTGTGGLANKAPGATAFDATRHGGGSFDSSANPSGPGFSGDATFNPGNGDSDRSTLLVGNALNLVDTRNDAIVVPVANTDLGTSFTISTWHALTPSGGSVARPFVFEQANNNFNISWGIGSGDSYTGYVTTSSSLGGIVLERNAWNHVAQVFDSDGTTTTLSLYVNGQLAGTRTGATANLTFNGINFGRARNSANGRDWDGMMDELNIWERALDASDVFALYNLGQSSQALTTNITSLVKDDNTTNLSLGGAWDTGNAPGSTDYLIIGSGFTQSAALDTGAAMEVAGLRVGGGSGWVDINNTSGTLTLGNLGLDMAAATRDMRVADLAAGTDQNWNIAAGRTLTLDGLSGTGDVTKMGAGSLVLNGGNSHEGTLNITGGLTTLGTPSAISPDGTIAVAPGAALTLRLGSGLFGTGDFDSLWNNSLNSVNMAAGARAGIDTDETVTLATDLSGTRGLALSGTGALVLTGDNNYTGGTTVAGGTLRIGDGGTTGAITGNIANSGTVAFNRSDDITYGNVISGSGGLVKDGGGRLTLTAVQSFTGDTVINDGILQINGGSPGSGRHRLNSETVRINAGGTLHFNGTAQFGWAAGTPDLVIDGGTITTANGTYQYLKDVTMRNGASIEFGTTGSSFAAVQAYSMASLVSEASSETNVISGGAMALNTGDSALTANVERGTAATDLRIETVLRNHPTNNDPGNLVKTGDGILELAATNTYTGTTTVSAGTLLVTGALGPTAVTVDSGATIGGSGTIGGPLIFNPGARLDLTGATINLTSTGMLGVSSSHVISLTDFAFSDIIGWDWFGADVGTYTLINGGSGVTLAGTTPTALSPYDFGDGRSGFFKPGSLQVVIIPEPSTLMFGLLLGFGLLRRRV